jgi:hypothetical protein
MDVGSQTFQGASTEVLCQYIQVLEPFVMPATIFIDVTTTLCVSSKNRISSPCHRRRGLVRILQWKLVAIPSKLGNAQATKSQGPAYLGPVDMAVATEQSFCLSNGRSSWRGMAARTDLTRVSCPAFAIMDAFQVGSILTIRLTRKWGLNLTRWRTSKSSTYETKSNARVISSLTLVGGSLSL